MTVVGVAWSGNDEQYQNFIDRHKITFPTISDTPGTVFEEYGVPYQPAWVLVGKDGSRIVRRGAMDESSLTEELANLKS